jgi:hypothetical protein
MKKVSEEAGMGLTLICRLTFILTLSHHLLNILQVGTKEGFDIYNLLMTTDTIVALSL